MKEDFAYWSTGGVCFGAKKQLSPKQCSQLLEGFERKVGAVRAVLGGRNGVVRMQVDDIGPVVIKQYRRGGVLRFLCFWWYLRWGKSRSESEFEMLEKVRAGGISAPEPIVFARRGNIVYRAWLVMREIDQEISLAELSLADEERAIAYAEELASKLRKLIDLRILHVDLHPGNALIDAHGKLFLVDFDKAIQFGGTAKQLRDKYLRRWRRAVIKHGLPESLNEAMSLYLRRSLDVEG